MYLSIYKLICHRVKNRPMDGFETKRKGRRRMRADIAPVQTLDRSLKVLETLSRNQPTHLSELSRLAGLHTSTVSRILETFRQRSYVEYDDHSGLYRVGVKTLEIGNKYLLDRPLNDAAHGAMKELSEALRETVNLVIRDGDMAVYIKQIQNESHAVRMFTQVGARVPIYCTAIGKAILGYLEEAEIRVILEGTEYVAFTENTVSSCDEFIVRAKESAKRGYAWDDEERELGVRCIAAPIFDINGQAIAAVSVSAPAMRLSIEQGEGYSLDLMQAARKISEQLGYAGESGNEV